MDIIDEDQIDPDDLDVAGHGFKEVAVGLGAVGIVLGGVTAAAAAAPSPAPGTMHGVHAVVGGVQDDVTDATPMVRWTSLTPPQTTKPQTTKPVTVPLNGLDYLKMDPAAKARAAADAEHAKVEQPTYSINVHTKQASVTAGSTHIQTPPPPPR